MSGLMRRHDRDRDRGLFPGLFGRFPGVDFFNMENDLPAVNVKENDKEFNLEVSVPGYDKGDINVDIDKNVLTISAKKETNNEEKDGEKVLRQEFSSSTFFRSFTIPENIDTEKIEAKQENGVLNISLPKLDKALEDKKKKIEIK
ncbi:MAG: Hsp20 family protein [Tannerellaceae bacterium]|nr:Hsp20 family protein [Tannerellaceae bacterium]